MPAWLEIILTPLAIYATLFFLVWALARDKLSRRARLLGWTAIIVTILGLLWSVWYESLRPCLRAGQSSAMLYAALQPLVMVTGAALTLYGAVRFLRAWGQMMFPQPATGTTFRKHIRSERRSLEEIRAQPTLQERLALAWKLIANLLLLPGLGWVCIGVGIAIAAGQLLEADRFFVPDGRLLTLAVFLTLGGGIQVWAARQQKSIESFDER